MSEKSPDIPDAIDHHTDTPVVSRVYDTVISMDSPAPVSDIADLALCTEDEAHAVLEVLHELRAIEKVEDGDTPAPQYCRNEAFFEWNRATRLASEFDKEELDDLQQQLRVQIETFQDIYNAKTVEDITLNTDHQGLREHMRSDAEQWILMEQTCEDIEFAQLLLDLQDNE